MLSALLFLAVGPSTVSVLDFGAKPDADTDNTAAFQRALDKAGEAGGTVEVPSGRYLIRGTLNVPEAVTLEGTFHAPARTIYTEARLEKEKGSILLTTHGKGDENGTPFITLNRSSTLKGLIVYYPEQTTDIVAYPWCVRGIGDNVTVKDTLLINPYQALDLGTHPAGRHKVDGLYAHALKTGLFVDKCFDVGRVEDVHFWPFWSGDQKVWDWTKKNGTAFKIARTDWEYMEGCFAIFYAVGYHFLALKDGPGNAVLTNCGSDIGPLAVKVDAVQRHAGVSFVNGQIMATVEVGTENEGPVKFTSCGFWGVEGVTREHARLSGRGTTTFTACHFIGWSQGAPGAYAISAQSGGLLVNGCEFIDEGPQVRHLELGPELDAAAVTGNRFRGKASVKNWAGRRANVAGNIEGSRR